MICSAKDQPCHGYQVSGVSPAAGLKSDQSNHKRNFGNVEHQEKVK
jgi:hypothetical protein